LEDLAARGCAPAEVCAWLATSLGLETDGEAVMAGDLLDRFAVTRVPSSPWRLTADDL
jgi:hypothetical protein